MRRVLAGTAALLALATGSAGATEPDATGWWWQAQQSALGAVTVPAPPSVPEDGLYVASGPTGEQAMSAVRLALPPGARASTLVLTIADASGEPVLGACAVLGSWDARHNAPYTQRPSVDTSRCTTGVVDVESRTATFDLGGIAQPGEVNVAVVAGLDADGTAPTFQASFAPPGDDAIAVTAASAQEPTPAPTPAASPAATAAPAPVPASVAVPAFTPAPPAPPTPIVALPDPLGSSPVAAAAQGGGVATHQPARDALTVVGLVGCTLLAGAWYVLDRREERAPRMLTSFRPAGADLTLSLGEDER